VQLLREDVRRHHGSVLTFEQQSDYMFEALGSTLWMDEELRL
jgi:hypothetical protein